MMVRALISEISFFDAFFKTHYTKGFRLTYPIPLPTTVAGIFGGMLGLSRKEAKEEFKDCMFGASFTEKSKYIENRENATYYLQDKKEYGAAPLHLLHEPSYYTVLAAKDERINEYFKKIAQNISFLPFGGQNDFFVKDWKVFSMLFLVKKGKEISNYAPLSFVEEIKEGTIIKRLPVMSKFEDEEFLFVIEGSVKLKQDVNICQINNKTIALYSLDTFYTVGEWK